MDKKRELRLSNFQFKVRYLIEIHNSLLLDLQTFVMEPSQFIFLILPLAIIIAVLVVVVFYLARRTEETHYEKEMKELRQSLFKGKLDRKTFLYIRDNLKTEDIFGDESKRLDDMMKHKELDPDTYIRMKKILEMNFNERLVKINEKYDFDNSVVDSDK